MKSFVRKMFFLSLVALITIIALPIMAAQKTTADTANEPVITTPFMYIDQFKTGSSEVTPVIENNLQVLLDHWQRNQNSHIVLFSVVNEFTTEKVAFDRIEAARNWLIKHGAKPDQITLIKPFDFQLSGENNSTSGIIVYLTD